VIEIGAGYQPMALPSLSAVTLVLVIAGALLLQLTIWTSLSVWRQWSALRKQHSSGETPTLLPAWDGFKRLRVTKTEFADAAHTILSIHLVAEDGQHLPDFLPGQYLTLRVGPIPEGAGGKTLVRCYSLSAAPGVGSYRISVKRAKPPANTRYPPGLASNHLHDTLKVGDLIEARAPSGYFVLANHAETPVLLAAGVGITPLISMLEQYIASPAQRMIWLFYGVRNGNEVMDAARLKELARTHPNFHLRLCFSDPLPHEQLGVDFQYAGRVSVEMLRQQLPFGRYQFYVCGPHAMTQSIVTGLENWGVAPTNIHHETFGPSSAKSHLSTSIDSKVTFTKSGRTFQWDITMPTLLDFAESKGLHPDAGCRSGSCGSCETVIESGEVTYLRKPDFDPQPGSCLLCSCIPKTDVSLRA